MALTTAQIQQAYVTFFSRPADAAGLNYWSSYAGSVADLYATFAQQAEYTAAFNGLSSAQKVNAVYQNLFGRDAEPTGLLYWAKALDAGSVTVANLALAVSAGSQGADSSIVANRVTAATAFTTALDTTAKILGYSGTAANASAKAWLSTVTDTAASLTAATAGVATAVTNTISVGGAAGSTFTLTTGIDNFAGTAAADTFGASLVFDANEAVTTASTVSVPDTIVGGAGVDTLNMTISGAQDAAVTIPAAGISGVETFNVRNTVAQTATLDATNFAGLTAANADRSIGALTVTGMTAAASGGVTGDGVTTNGATSFGWGATVTSGAVNIANGATAGAVTTVGTLLATNTVNSTGAANTIGALTLGAAVTTLNVNATTALTTGAVTNTTAAALTKINVTGAGAVNLSTTALESTVTTIDASGSTGGLTVALGSAATQKVTGSSGNDVITTGAVLTTGSVDAGAGVDVLDVGTNVSHVNTTSLAAKYTNFETVRIGAAALDMSLIGGINAVQLTGAATLTNMTAAQAAAVTARANIGNASLALATATGTSDVLTITNGLGTTTAAATTIGTLVATGFETINLAANPGPSATTGANRTTTVTAITDTSLTAVNLTGTAFTFGDIASTKAVAWNASALTGNGASTPVGLTLTTTGAAFAGSSVTGSAVRDSVIMDSSTGVTFNLGAGNDIFSTTSTLLLPSGASTDNTVNAGEGTADKLVFTGAATLTDTSFTKTSGFEALELAGAGVANSVTGLAAGFLTGFAGGVTVTDTAAQSGANTYTWSSGLYAQPVTLTHETTYVGTAAGGNQAITTGAGNDTVTVTASSWVGATGGAAGQITVSTGAGNDTISVTTGTLLAHTTTTSVTITGGTGKDVITAVGVNAATGLTPTFVIAAGDSLVSSYDSITGFDLGSGALFSSTLDFASVGLTAYAATAPSGSSAAELTVAVSAAGVVTFAGTKAATLTLADKIAAVQSVVTTNAGDSALFTDGANTYVFNNNTAGDSLVELVGVTGLSLVTANATTAGAIFIA